MILPASHKLEYEGKMYNWFVGDPVTYPKYLRGMFWAFAVPESIGWNTIHAEYCGKFNDRTREITDINKLSKK